MSAPRTARVTGQDGRGRRTIDPATLKARRSELLNQPPSPERSAELRRLGHKIRNLEYRSPRYGD